MSHDFLYMLGIVVIGFVINYGLRALPFLLFAGEKRAIPNWIVKSSAYVSPVIIGCLILYSYSGLQWRTPWPYLAGALTIGLQLLVKNPLASIVAGTALYMCLVTTGCAHESVMELDAEHTSIAITPHAIMLNEEPVKMEELLETLDRYEIPKDRVIHIYLDPEVKDMRAARAMMACLAKAGWTRPVLVTKRHAESAAVGKKKPKSFAPTAENNQPKVIRYKKATE